MKRFGDFIELIADYENCINAFCRASIGKGNRQEVIVFRDNLNNEIQSIQRSLAGGGMFTFQYRSFTVADPKPRVIQVAPFRVRVVHHAIMNVIGDFLERRQYSHSYACLKGRGTHAAIEYVRASIDGSSWYLKMDVRKFFDSISHEVLLSQLMRIFKDQKLLQLLNDIIKGFQTTCNRGLPIGNLTSQYFANHYLTPLDHFIKHELKVKYYVRYMDDLLIYNLSKDELKCIRNRIAKYASEVLRLSFKVAQVNAINRGIPFLGMRIFPTYMRLSAVAIRRFRKRWRLLYALLSKGKISERDASVRLNAVMAFAKNTNTLALRRKLMAR